MKRNWFDWLIPLAFVFLSFFFFRPYFTQKKVPLPFNLLVSFYSPWKYEPEYGVGIANKPLGDDNLKLFYPYRKFTIEEVKNGNIPLWNPYTFSGSVHHAMYQSAVFYPLTIIYFLLAQQDAWTVLILVQPILTGWFTYLFLRSLRLPRGPSLFGALAFSLSGWMIALWQEVLVITHTIMWLPLALYASNVVWEGKNKEWGFLILIASLGFSFLAGFPQMNVYLVGTFLLWNFHKWAVTKINKRSTYIFMVFSALIFALLLTAFQWIPALEAYLNAPRVRVDNSYLFKTFLSPLVHIITFLAPDFWGNPGTYNYFGTPQYLQERTIFIGIPALILAFYAYSIRSIPAFWKIFSFVTLSLGFALPTSWIFYVLKVPILSVAMPVRIFVLAIFGLCTLAAYGLARFPKKNVWRSLRWPAGMTTATLIGLWGFVYVMRIKSWQSNFILEDQEAQKRILAYGSVSFRNLILPTAFLIATLVSMKVFKRNTLVLVLCGITLAGSLHLANKLLYFSDRNFEYPMVEPIRKLKELARYDRVWSYGDGYIVRNILSYFDLYSAEGYEALYSHRYGTFLNTIVTRGILSDQIHRTDATLSETGQYEAMANNPVRLRLMSLLGVKYVLEHKKPDADKVLAPAQRFPPDLFFLAWENDRWRIWEYKQSLPRVFLASRTVVEVNPQKIIDRLLDPATDMRKTLVVETDEASILTSGEDEGSASLVEYFPSLVTMRTESKQPSLLFLSDPYYPGWKAFIDGQETEIYRTNFVLRAVKVPEGNHDVRFVYDPLSWKIGLYISGTGLVVLVIFVMIKNRRHA